ncbi:dna mismatch repair protein mutl [hydrocarbon metagenome]|uniref:Dna mismatch repair protein mutl n=1 Tax=hydrocarbon metagenome TaxID=938273 RepID=A0A0W8FZ65_9ZZZZ
MSKIMIKSKIKILPENISNKIAAGEVVQRPESVVKELLENSVDANAKNIEVYIKQAGKSLIQIVDDGDGMGEDDSVQCIQRHATSKISSVEDLEEIKTYGFRGEALSSIASVSLVEIKTEEHDSEIGTLIKNNESGEFIKEKGSFPKGTSIAVKNLFFNTPARRNFLKTNSTELKHIIETFKKISISRPEISFKFYNDDDLIFDYAAGTFEERLQQVFADNILDAVIPVSEKTDFLSIYGYIGKPTFTKKDRSDQYVFINRRYVVSRTVNHSVFSAYENILEKGNYPFFVLFVELDPRRIDINVHPSKLEVKFEDEKDIYAFINAVVKKSIGSHDLVPSMTFNEAVDDHDRLKFTSSGRSNRGDFSDRPRFNTDQKSNRSSIFSEEEIDRLFDSLKSDISSTSVTDEIEHPFEEKHSEEVYHLPKEAKLERSRRDEPIDADSSFIVLLHNKYILSQIKSGLMIIDSHVAHERILFEKALRSFEANIPFSQQLLFSQKIQVDPADYELLKQLEPYLNKLGFEIKFMSKNTVAISGVPSDVKIGSEKDALLEILFEFRKNEQEKQLEVRDNLAKSFSCKAAIKAGDKLTEQEMRILVDQLFATSMPYVCPHGRPIVIKIPLTELDKRFGRT